MYVWVQTTKQELRYGVEGDYNVMVMDLLGIV